jgi:hypothetical protein
MNTRITGSLLAATALAAVCFLFLLPGCSEKEGGSREMGLPPDTFISYGPKQATRTYFKVQAYWYGADQDGDVVYFQYATIKNAEQSDLESIDLDTLTWHDTYEQERTFLLPADSCCLDSIENPSQDPMYAKGLWGILVRAVDNEGLKDPTPDALFFTATNVIPLVSIVVPEKSGSYETTPPHPYLEWEGEDPDGDPAGLEYKYIVIHEDSLNPSYPKLPPLEYVDDQVEGHASPQIGKWSYWVPADCTHVTDLDLTSYIYPRTNRDHHLMIFVTVRDEGGAYLPESIYGMRYGKFKNQIELVVTPVGTGVTITLDGGSLGRRFSGQVATYTNDIAAIFKGTEISFRFWGFEQKGRGQVAAAYRFYWDNPDDPMSAWNYWTSTAPIREDGANPEWYVRYPLDGSRFAPSLGRHVFVVEVRDLNGEVTHVEFNLEVLEGPRRLTEGKILLVDDDRARYIEQAHAGFEAMQLALWEDILDGYNWELFDTGIHYDKDVPVRSVGSATTVIWLADTDVEETPMTQLLRACTNRGNFLYSYVKVGGNLIIIGNDPVRGCCYFSDYENVEPRRGNRTTFAHLDLKPIPPASAAEDTSYNFLWDIMGIRQMDTPTKVIPYNMIWPCALCASGWEGPIEALPPGGGWTGEFGNAFYITRLRDTHGDPRAPVVEPMYSTAYDTSGVITPTETNFIAVYARPGQDQEVRGHAAYIGFPAEWFDHEKMKAVIDTLLTRFGETPE